ncbi:mevalonate kinase [Fundicoccus sp. Sow4_H7]|uniref:mevalonate kinase n=1 Tax=Fundicoccus sp. Sow4_H7 TaxID=3438784 RepID=UPI003F8FA9BB
MNEFEEFLLEQETQLNNKLGEKAEAINAIGHGYAHSKIILMGEHAVVYDFPAIALPFSGVQVHSIATKSKDDVSSIDCMYFTGPLSKAPTSLKNVICAIDISLQSLKVNIPVHIQIESTIPQERGMGSSAAVAVSVIRALYNLFDQPLDDQQLQYIANQAEVIAHESTSGLDTLLASSNQPFIYRKSKPAVRFSLKLNAYLVVADSGQAGQTKLAVKKVMKRRKDNPDFSQKILTAIGQFVTQAFDAISKGDVQSLGRLMTYNHYYLNQLGVSNEHLDVIVSAAWQAGALGAKLTGGGLGGCVIALAETKAEAITIAQAMQVAGAVQSWYIPLHKE